MLRRILSASLFASLIAALPIQAASAAQGLNFASQDELRGVPLAATPFSGASLPVSVDLSPNMPPPGNQGAQNSCVGWATAYALKSYQEKVEEHRTLSRNGTVDPKMVFSPAFIYHQINNGRDGGSSFIDALNLLSSQGAVSLADMPYSEKDYQSIPPARLMNQAKRYRIDYWRQVNIRDLKEVKAQLSAGYPVLIGAMIDEGFVHAKTGHIWRQQVGKSLGGHAMALVGYDDRRQAFKLINSWGQGWGDQGFGWIDYKFFPQAVREGYVAKDALNGPAPSNNDPVINPSLTDNPRQTAPPEPVADQAEFEIAKVQHNLPAPATEYQKYGPFMKVTGPIQIPPGAGKKMQVVVRFYYDDGHGGKGKPVATGYPELFSIADEGVAATGTPQIQLPPNGIADEWYAFIPYNAFRLPAGKVNLVGEPMLYVDSFGIRTGDLIHFWVQTPGDRAKVPTQQTPAQQQPAAGAAEAARSFFQAMYNQSYTQAWGLLTEASKNGISQLVGREAGVSTAEIRQMFDSSNPTIMQNFWPTMRKSMKIDVWAKQSYTLSSQNGSQAWVTASPQGVKMLMKYEGGRWKLGYMETFMDN